MLFTYCIPYDDGAAPNPFWGLCTLAICKPVIRRMAQPGDWVVGTGSITSPVGNTAGRVVYAMRVSAVMSMSEYDSWTRSELPNKVPAWSHRDHRRRLGDSIYDFAVKPCQQRRSVHGPENISTDLRGRNVLLSEDFFYFGNAAVSLPDNLLPIVKQGQGHRSWSNEPHVEAFAAWIDDLGLGPGIHGDPQLDLFADENAVRTCSRATRAADVADEQLGDDSYDGVVSRPCR